MSSSNESLLEAADAAPKQLELVPSTELAAAFFEDGETVRGEFTAARLFSLHPDKYQAIIGLVAEHEMSLRGIARALKVSVNTIKAVCHREGLALEVAKEEVVKDYKLVERLALDRLIERMDALKPEALAMVLGIVRDKINAMEGTPTTIIGHIHAQAPIEDINAFIDALPAADGAVLENGSPQTGVSDGKVSAMTLDNLTGEPDVTDQATEGNGGSDD